MGRVLVVELLEACNVPQNIRHLKGLKVKPFVKATSGAGGQEYATAVDEEGQEPGTSTTRWTAPFRVRLPDEEELQLADQRRRRPPDVLFRLFIRRTMKPHKHLASVRVPLTEFKESADSTVCSVSMEFTQDKYAVKAQGVKIELRIKAHIVEDESSSSSTDPAYLHTPDGHEKRPASKSGPVRVLRKIGEAGMAILTISSAVIGLEDLADN